MLFNSLGFLLFFPTICLVYWSLGAFFKGNVLLHTRNVLLLMGSYYFYMCWEAVYALLLFFSTIITFVGGLAIESYAGKKSLQKAVIWIVLICNISLLFYFKYWNFAAQQLSSFFSLFDWHIKVPGMNYLLPVGISFYIFQAIGYTIDVYRGDVGAERNLSRYALFVSFFPQLVAGPIERSRNLLQQFKSLRTFDYGWAISGFKLMLWGYFMKLCLADNASIYVDQVYNNIHNHPGLSASVASVFFTLQVYGDFAGYTFIAIGAARIMGFSLSDNFRRPYFSASISEFWRRWHISLSSWLRDYVYIPLGGSRSNKKWKVYRNLLLTFSISGLWHGAQWTFVLWGVVNGLFLCIERAVGVSKRHWHGIKRLLHVAFTLLLVNMAWVLFRSPNLSEAMEVYRQIFCDNLSLNDTIQTFTSNLHFSAVVLFSTILLLVVELRQEFKWNWRWSHFYVVSDLMWPIFLLVCIALLGQFQGAKFIYFQF